MRKDKKLRIVAIIALTISVLSLTLGFAAFSNILTISSSATVSPNASDFKMVIYGVENGEDTVYNSTTISCPYLQQDATATIAKINNSSLSITDINVNLIRPGDTAFYDFQIVNEGKYTAYITQDSLNSIFDIQNSKICTPDVGTSKDMVQEVCSKGIEIYLNAYNIYDSQIFDSQSFDNPSYLEIPVGESLLLTYGVVYRYSSSYVDGNFAVNIPDLKLEFSTIEPVM